MASAPIAFKHDLDLDLFTLDRLDHLCRTAPEGKLKVQHGDEGFERPAGASPTFTRIEGSLAEDLARRRLHVHLHDVIEWAGPGYRDSYERVMATAGGDPNDRHALSMVIRVFTPGVPVALHADGEIAIDCGVGGTNVWHFLDREVLGYEEHEAMHRGGQFLRRRDGEPVTMPLEPGDGCVVPPRWPHWLEHPGETPAVSFDVGYWTSAAIRERKVYDVNWLMRRAHLTPTPPGISGRRDALKLHAFDLVSRVTGKGAEYRGR